MSTKLFATVLKEENSVFDLVLLTAYSYFFILAPSTLKILNVYLLNCDSVILQEEDILPVNIYS